MFWILGGLASAAYILYKLEFHEIVKKKYEDFQELNELVETKEKRRLWIFLKSCGMIGRLLWFNFLNKLNNSIEHKDKHTLIFTYAADGRLYKIVVPKRRGPPKVLLVLDEADEDVCDLVLPFYGPERNWGGRKFTPSFWGKKRLVFEMANGETRKFEEGEVVDV